MPVPSCTFFATLTAPQSPTEVTMEAISFYPRPISAEPSKRIISDGYESVTAGPACENGAAFAYNSNTCPDTSLSPETPWQAIESYSSSSAEVCAHFQVTSAGCNSSGVYNDCHYPEQLQLSTELDVLASPTSGNDGNTMLQCSTLPERNHMGQLARHGCYTGDAHDMSYRYLLDTGKLVHYSACAPRPKKKLSKEERRKQERRAREQEAQAVEAEKERRRRRQGLKPQKEETSAEDPECESDTHSSDCLSSLYDMYSCTCTSTAGAGSGLILGSHYQQGVDQAGIEGQSW
ncbi:hypothetical protein B0T14DRAFT_512999 [Immersiella caudata]|uniref:Uncharacterized protein n=1 Tax=Immersiella caudata TaxID=314043 RepID=A0AA39X6C7_9PEZI|nr:hypothetical protein B0T14DRAFT_512999 [Immersiella caudata]